LRPARRSAAFPGGRLRCPLRRKLGLRQPAACADGGAARGVAASRAGTRTRRSAVCLVHVQRRRTLDGQLKTLSRTTLGAASTWNPDVETQREAAGSHPEL
jgi:hypothetical protein